MRRKFLRSLVYFLLCWLIWKTPFRNIQGTFKICLKYIAWNSTPQSGRKSDHNKEEKKQKMLIKWKYWFLCVSNFMKYLILTVHWQLWQQCLFPPSLQPFLSHRMQIFRIYHLFNSVYYLYTELFEVEWCATGIFITSHIYSYPFI